MRALTYLFPTIALAGAALLLTTSQGTYGFSTIGGSLSAENQRDFRVFNNFADPGSNNNTTADPQFPGWDGAERAVWKGASEWASRSHGSGAGDPSQPNLGDGGANFDFVFAGAASAQGTTNNNIVSTTTNCSSGVFAFVQTPISDGWRMRFCDPQWTWIDGPGLANGNNIDIQGIGTHEFGHSLGLGHSSVNGATMFASAVNGNSQRSIAPDDIAGVQFVYGAAAGNKLEILNVNYDDMSNVLTIVGQDFSASNNQVWFTNGNVTSTGADPRVIVSGVSSTAGGTQIAVTVPANAATGGDVHVKGNFNGGASLSNGFPYSQEDPEPPMETPPVITSITPSTVESLIVGTDQTVSIQGTDFTPDMTVTIDGFLIAESSMTRIGTTEVTVDMPTGTQLGAVSVDVVNSEGSDSDGITVVAPTGLVLQVGEGAVPSFINASNGIDIATAGPVGTAHYVILSSSSVPSVIPIVSLDLGNNFLDLNLATFHVIPANGVFHENIPIGPTFAVWYFQSISLNFGTPIPTSNLQNAIVTP